MLVLLLIIASTLAIAVILMIPITKEYNKLNGTNYSTMQFVFNKFNKE